MRYIVDMAEIPTFQEIQETGFVAKADDASAKHTPRTKLKVCVAA